MALRGRWGFTPPYLLTYGGPLSHMCMSQDIQISTAWVIGASQSEQGHRSLKDIPLTWAPSTGLENRLHHRCNHLESSDTHILHALPTYPQAHPLSSPSECVAAAWGYAQAGTHNSAGRDTVVFGPHEVVYLTQSQRGGEYQRHHAPGHEGE